MHFRAIGSGNGRKELAADSGVPAANVQNQFAASDVPTTTAGYLNFPAVVAAIGVFVNLPVGTGGYAVNMSACTLNDIYSGVITTWDHANIKAQNPNLLVPTGQPIVVGVRSDGSGTSQVFSGWLSGLGGSSGSYTKCATGEGAFSTHPFGSNTSPNSPWATNTIANKYFYSSALPAGAATTAGQLLTGIAPATNTAVIPSNVVFNAGSQGQVTWVQNTLWSLAYVDNGQAIATGLQEVALMNTYGVYVQSQNAVLTNSVPATLPYPDGSAFTTGATPTQSGAGSWAGSNGVGAAGNLYDAQNTNVANTTLFPVVLFSYIIIPTSFLTPITAAYDAESAAMLLALLQYLYHPETTVGYNAGCGYSNGVLNLGSTPSPYSCSAYSTPSILAGFYFQPLNSAWMTSVLGSLQTAAATGTLAFGSGGTPYTLWTNTNAASVALSVANYASSTPGFTTGTLNSVAVPLWVFEPTENYIPYSNANYWAAAGGAGERIISYNRMSYADFQRTQNAEQSATNAASIAALQTAVVGTAGSTLGDRTITYRLYGSGSSLQSKLIWRAMDLLMQRSKISVRMSYRSIGSGNGRNEFTGATNTPAYQSWGHFGASDAPFPTTSTASPPATATYTNLYTTQSKPFLTIPSTVAAVSIFHSIPSSALAPGINLNLTINALCGIYTGAITTWNNAAITGPNPNLKLPASAPSITVLARQDGSGTTAVFTGWMATTCTTGNNIANTWTVTGVAGSQLTATSSPTWPTAANVQYRPNTIGMTATLQANSPSLVTWAVGYLDSGFGADGGLTEAALELRSKTTLGTASTTYVTVAGLGTAGLAAPTNAGYSTTSGYPSSFADWSVAPASGITVQSQLYNQWGGSGQQIFPMCTFSYVFLRKDMSMYGESGRLATAMVKFLFSADAGTPVDYVTTPETPTSPLKFYGDLLMAQPPSSVITQALADMQQITFSASALQDWGFESYWTASGNPVSSASSSGTPTAGYIQFQGFGDRIFSVWRSDYFDYKSTVDAQTIAANQAGITKNLLSITANAATIATNVATLQSLQTVVTATSAQATTTATTVTTLQSTTTTLQTQLTAAQALISQLQSTVASLQGNISTTSVTVSGSTTTSSTSSTTTSVATAAIVVGAVGVLLSALLGCYVIYLKPKNVSEGNKMAVSLSPMSAPNV